MTSYRLNELRTLAAASPVVFVVGARGTGKTNLMQAYASSCTALGTETLLIDLRTCETLAETTEPIAARLSLDPQFLDPGELHEDVRLRVLFDNAHAVAGRPWLGQLQDVWRHFFAAPESGGRVSAVFFGRPSFRGSLGGRGSPLANVAAFLPPRPMSMREIRDAWQIDDPLARGVHRYSGGHPQLSRELLEATGGDVSRIGPVARTIAESRGAFLMRLVDDHGLAARRVVASVLDRNSELSEAAALEVLASDPFVAQMALQDLVGSGLVNVGEAAVELNAELLRYLPSARVTLALPDTVFEEEPPEQNLEAGRHLYRFENRLRRKIAELLAAEDELWWPRRIPGEQIVADAEARLRQEREFGTSMATPQHPLAYTNFGELSQILLSGENWSRTFRFRLRADGLELSLERTERLLRDVAAVRNRVAHCRPVSDSDLRTMEIAFLDIFGEAQQSDLQE